MKHCSKCESYKSLTSFHKDKTSKDGYRHICKECARKYGKIYSKTYYQDNKAHIRQRRKNRLDTDINCRLASNLRGRLCKAISRETKSGSAIKDLGCSVEQVKQYLENKFQPNWTWDNWGKVWHIDHIKPLSSFDLTDRKQFKKACHYTNLQPLSVTDNLSKGDRT